MADVKGNTIADFLQRTENVKAPGELVLAYSARRPELVLAWFHRMVRENADTDGDVTIERDLLEGIVRLMVGWSQTQFELERDLNLKTEQLEKIEDLVENYNRLVMTPVQTALLNMRRSLKNVLEG